MFVLKHLKRLEKSITFISRLNALDYTKLMLKSALYKSFKRHKIKSIKCIQKLII